MTVARTLARCRRRQSCRSCTKTSSATCEPHQNRGLGAAALAWLLLPWRCYLSCAVSHDLLPHFLHLYSAASPTSGLVVCRSGGQVCLLCCTIAGPSGRRCGGRGSRAGRPAPQGSRLRRLPAGPAQGRPPELPAAQEAVATYDRTKWGMQKHLGDSARAACRPSLPAALAVCQPGLPAALAAAAAASDGMKRGIRKYLGSFSKGGAGPSTGTASSRDSGSSFSDRLQCLSNSERTGATISTKASGTFDTQRNLCSAEGDEESWDFAGRTQVIAAP